MDIVINLTLSAKASRQSFAGLLCCPYNMGLMLVSTFPWVWGEPIFARRPRCQPQESHATVVADVTSLDHTSWAWARWESI